MMMKWFYLIGAFLLLASVASSSDEVEEEEEEEFHAFSKIIFSYQGRPDGSGQNQTMRPDQLPDEEGMKAIEDYNKISEAADSKFADLVTRIVDKLYKMKDASEMMASPEYEIYVLISTISNHAARKFPYYEVRSLSSMFKVTLMALEKLREKLEYMEDDVAKAVYIALDDDSPLMTNIRIIVDLASDDAFEDLSKEQENTEELIFAPIEFDMKSYEEYIKEEPIFKLKDNGMEAIESYNGMQDEVNAVFEALNKPLLKYLMDLGEELDTESYEYIVYDAIDDCHSAAGDSYYFDSEGLSSMGTKVLEAFEKIRDNIEYMDQSIGDISEVKDIVQPDSLFCAALEMLADQYTNDEESSLEIPAEEPLDVFKPIKLAANFPVAGENLTEDDMVDIEYYNSIAAEANSTFSRFAWELERIAESSEDSYEDCASGTPPCDALMAVKTIGEYMAGSYDEYEDKNEILAAAKAALNQLEIIGTLLPELDGSVDIEDMTELLEETSYLYSSLKNLAGQYVAPPRAPVFSPIVFNYELNKQYTDSNPAYGLDDEGKAAILDFNEMQPVINAKFSAVLDEIESKPMMSKEEKVQELMSMISNYARVPQYAETFSLSSTAKQMLLSIFPALKSALEELENVDSAAEVLEFLNDDSHFIAIFRTLASQFSVQEQKEEEKTEEEEEEEEEEPMSVLGPIEFSDNFPDDKIPLTADGKAAVEQYNKMYKEANGTFVDALNDIIEMMEPGEESYEDCKPDTAECNVYETMNKLAMAWGGVFEYKFQNSEELFDAFATSRKDLMKLRSLLGQLPQSTEKIDTLLTFIAKSSAFSKNIKKIACQKKGAEDCQK